MFAAQLAVAIDVDGAGDINLGVWPACAPIEDVVGGDMHQAHPLIEGGTGKMARALFVHRHGFVGIAFGLVDGGIGGRVDDAVRPYPVNHAGYGRTIPDVQIDARQTDQIPVGWFAVAQAAPQLPACPGQQYFQVRFPPGWFRP
jgi:hypothetical protein